MADNGDWKVAVDHALQLLLILHPGSNKRELARLLSGSGVQADASSVNSRLYAMLKSGRVAKDDSTPPRWTCVDDVPAPQPHEELEPGGRTGLLLRAWQEDALTAWECAGGIGVVEAVTGTGKTQVGIEGAYGAIEDGGCALVIVPTKALLHQRTARPSSAGSWSSSHCSTPRTEP